MSNLRKHLEAEKALHQEARYPGDLVKDILPLPVMNYSRRESWTRSPLALILGALAAAAVIAIAIPVWHRLMLPVAMQTAEVQPQPQEEEMPFVLNTTVSMPADVPIIPTSNETMTPDYQSMSFPSVPSFSDSSDNDVSTQTSKEST